MTDNLNINANLCEGSREGSSVAEEFNKGPDGDMTPFYEEITVMKTEIKEELYDPEMVMNHIEFVNVIEEDNFLPEVKFEEEDVGLGESTEQSLNENLVSGNVQLREEDIQKKQKLEREKQDRESKKFKCANCKYATHQKYVLEKHIRIHTNDRPFKCTYKNCKCTAGQEEFCKCSMCGYAATLKHTLKGHILAKHSAEPKKYKCADCNYATHKKQSLEKHIRLHTNDRPFKCTYKNCECTPGQEESCKCSTCGYAAIQKSTLKVHILTKHSAGYKCVHCNYATDRKFKLKRHIRVHTNDRPYKCTYKNCECTAGQEESCKCSMCGYAARHKNNLRVHILAKHRAEPKKFYTHKVEPTVSHPYTYQ